VIVYHLRYATVLGTYISSPELLIDFLLSFIFGALTACLIFSFVEDGEGRRSVGPIG
jgi:hypothetical protein